MPAVPSLFPWPQYMASPAAAQFLQAGVERMQRETNCFDLPSVLIRPVQRILKYPLLLNELNKVIQHSVPGGRQSAVALCLPLFLRARPV